MVEILIGHYFWTFVVTLGTLVLLEMTFTVLFGKKSILDASKWYKVPPILLALVYCGSLLLPLQTHTLYVTEYDLKSNAELCFYVEATVSGGVYFTSKWNKPDYYAEYVHDELCSVEPKWELKK